MDLRVIHRKNSIHISYDVCLEDQISRIRTRFKEHLEALLTILQKRPLIQECIIETLDLFFGLLRTNLIYEHPQYYGTAYDMDISKNTLILHLFCIIEMECMRAIDLVNSYTRLHGSIMDIYSELLKQVRRRKLFLLYKHPRCFKYLSLKLSSLFTFYRNVEIARYQFSKYPFIIVRNIPSLSDVHRPHGPLLVVRPFSATCMEKFLDYIYGIETSETYLHMELVAFCSFCKASLDSMDNFAIIDCCKCIVCPLCQHLHSWKEW